MWFTGTQFTDTNRYEDSPAERFAKLVPVAKQFGICQFGVCLFHDRGEAGIVASPFNFNVLNDQRDVLVNAGTLGFLAKNGFDFSKWFGQPYHNTLKPPKTTTTTTTNLRSLRVTGGASFVSAAGRHHP